MTVTVVINNTSSGFARALKELAKGETLEEKYHDHQLSGKLKDFRDCHVRPDLVLVYKIQDAVLQLYLYRVGSHSKLFRTSFILQSQGSPQADDKAFGEYEIFNKTKKSLVDFSELPCEF